MRKFLVETWRCNSRSWLLSWRQIVKVFLPYKCRSCSSSISILIFCFINHLKHCVLGDQRAQIVIKAIVGSSNNVGSELQKQTFFPSLCLNQYANTNKSIRYWEKTKPQDMVVNTPKCINIRKVTRNIFCKLNSCLIILINCFRCCECVSSRKYQISEATSWLISGVVWQKTPWLANNN